MLPADVENNPFIKPVRVNFDPETGSIIVEIDKKDFGFVDRQIRYNNKIFQPKRELHITILSEDAAERVRLFTQKKPNDQYNLVDVIDETTWAFRKQDELYHVVNEAGEETIIQMVNIVDLESFFSRLSQLLKHGLVLPPTHVTLYTFRSDIGIRLATQEEFKQRVKARISPGELQPVNPTRAPGSDQGLVQ